MRTLILTTALCAFCTTALATAGQQKAETAQQLQNTVMNATQAEIGAKQNHHIQQAPTSGSAFTYCQANPNSQGHVAEIGYSGSLVLTVHSFTLGVAGQTIHPASFGMFTYGTQQYNVPFGNGYLCISPFAPGIFRMPVQALTQPTIQLAMEDAENQFAMFTPGSSWNFQFWYRDPQAGGARFNLSNALHVDFPAGP
jgi:hypothetical protein